MERRQARATKSQNQAVATAVGTRFLERAPAARRLPLSQPIRALPAPRIILGTMTDREMAQQIAEELVRLRNRVDSLEILMTNYRTLDREGTPIPWRHDLAEMEKLEEYQELLRDRSLALAQLFDGGEAERFPFRAVWKNTVDLGEVHFGNIHGSSFSSRDATPIRSVGPTCGREMSSAVPVSD